MACDYRGNVLAAADYFETPDHSFPVKGVRTFYGWLGDWLPGLCAGMLAVPGLAAVRARVSP
jgi:hypothetical protein